MITDQISPACISTFSPAYVYVQYISYTQICTYINIHNKLKVVYCCPTYVGLSLQLTINGHSSNNTIICLKELLNWTVTCTSSDADQNGQLVLQHTHISKTGSISTYNATFGGGTGLMKLQLENGEHNLLCHFNQGGGRKENISRKVVVKDSEYYKYMQQCITTII